MKPSDRRRRILEEAWIGDAVLSLYARSLILTERSAVDSEALERMTSNHFLAAFGEPSEVEAELGRVYRDHGLDRAFAWIEEKLMPVYRRQEENRLRRAGTRTPTRPLA
jgi:dsRNA-specific ribonuclease